MLGREQLCIALPLDLVSSDGDVGRVVFEQVELGSHAEVNHVLLPIEAVHVKVKLEAVFLGHE